MMVSPFCFSLRASSMVRAFRPDLDKYDLEKDSFYRILAEEYGMEFSYDKEVISAVLADGEVSEALYEKDSYIALKIIDVLYDVGQRPLEYSESWYHADQYSYLSISVKRETVI